MGKVFVSDLMSQEQHTPMAARALGLEMPISTELRADDAIEYRRQYGA
jgi:hypothetical protein